MKRFHSIPMLALVLWVLPAAAGAGVRGSLSALGGAAIAGSHGPGGATVLQVLAEPTPALSIGLEIGSQYFRAPQPRLYLMPLGNAMAVDGINRNATFFMGPVMRANFTGRSGRIYLLSSIGYQSWTSHVDYFPDQRGGGTEESFGVGLERSGRVAPAVEVRWRGMQAARSSAGLPDAFVSSVSVAGGLHFR